jgi:23S rRNA pseudouridine1911/1915/1917 synthase
MNEPTIVHEDNHCLVVNKPAGMPSQGDESGDRSLVDWARDDLKRRHQKPGNVFVGLVHRLDRPVSGVIVLARTSKGASRLSEQFRLHTVEKIYWAIVEGRVSENSAEWTDWLVKDSGKNMVRVVDRAAPGAQEATLGISVLERGDKRTLLEVRPTTGRGHQIRVQLASRGLPIVGDRRYGAKSSLLALDGGHRIALHARRLAFIHPTRSEAIECGATVPADWPELASDC